MTDDLRGQVCKAEESAAMAAMPPDIAMPGEHREPKAVSAPTRAPVQFMGCLPRAYPLRRTVIDGERRAVTLVEEPSSFAVIVSYRSAGRRDAAIARWLQRWAPAGSPGKPTTLHITEQAHVGWTLPDGSRAAAVYPENKRSGYLCLVRANVAALPEALPALNNWCWTSFGLWRED